MNEDALNTYNSINEALSQVYIGPESEIQNESVSGSGKIKGNLFTLQQEFISDYIEPAIDEFYFNMFNKYVGNAPSITKASYIFKDTSQSSINNYYFLAPPKKRGDEHVQINDERVKTQFFIDTGTHFKKSHTINAVFTSLSNLLVNHDIIIRQLGNKPKKGTDRTVITAETGDSFLGWNIGNENSTIANASVRHAVWVKFEQGRPEFQGEGWFKACNIQINNIGSPNNHIRLSYGKKASPLRSITS